MVNIPTDNKINKENHFKSGEIKNLILSAIGVSAIIGGSVLLTPNFPIVLGMIIKIIEEVKQIKLPKSKITRTLKQLEKRQIIALEKENDNIIVKVLEKGRTDVFKYSIKSILDLKKKEKKWNGKWFLVFFDVPEQEKKKREYLRGFLKEIGFYPYQKSVYIFPYECESEIKLIKQIVESASYMSYIIAEKIEYEEKIKRYFNI